MACLAASRDRDPATRRVADSRLHLAIAAASGSPSLAAAVADVQLTLDRLLAAIPVIRRNLDHSDAQHARVVDAILAGDAAGRPGGDGGALRRARPTLAARLAGVSAT